MPYCDAPGCSLLAVGILVFEGTIEEKDSFGRVVKRTHPTWPWRWSCHDHAKRENMGVTDSLVGQVREAFAKRLSDKKIVNLVCGLSLNLNLPGFEQLTLEEQVAKLRQDAATEGNATLRAQSEVPATFVSVDEFKEILNDPSLRGLS
jgi:hypothetical protein